MGRLNSVFLLLAVSFSAQSSDYERENLSSYLTELEKIDRLYQKAKSSRQDKEQTKHRFDYGQFEADLEKFKKGIEEYLNAPKRTPRALNSEVSPIKGSY